MYVKSNADTKEVEANPSIIDLTEPSRFGSNSIFILKNGELLHLVTQK